MYLWIKAFHIVFIASWFAGLFYLPRIYVNLAQETNPAATERLLGMARRLFRFTTMLAVKIVDGIDAAMDHINTFSSKHTEAIVTEDYSAAMRFLREVDSASVMVNASTRFADGFEYGLGAEIGISNDKLHARGPVVLEGLTSLKYVVFGHGEIRN